MPRSTSHPLLNVGTSTKDSIWGLSRTNTLKEPSGFAELLGGNTEFKIHIRFGFQMSPVRKIQLRQLYSVHLYLVDITFTFELYRTNTTVPVHFHHLMHRENHRFRRSTIQICNCIPIIPFLGEEMSEMELIIHPVVRDGDNVVLLAIYGIIPSEETEETDPEWWNSVSSMKV